MTRIPALQPGLLERSHLTIGTFDGVHRGHQSLIRALVEGARAASLPAAVITFFPHPVEVIRGIRENNYLSDPQEKTRLLQNLGVDQVITLDFTAELAALSAAEFTRQIRQSLNFTRLVIGPDFALGKGREGHSAWLQQDGEKHGYEVKILPPLEDSGGKISSSGIRQLLESGNVSAAASGLGRPYRLSGEVILGDQRGRTLGFPTANLNVWPRQLLPRNGVYAARAFLGEESFVCFTNIGTRPTFQPDAVEKKVEAYLLDFDRDIYGRQLTLDFYEFIRPEMRFENKDALIAQIQKDIQFAREVAADGS